MSCLRGACRTVVLAGCLLLAAGCGDAEPVVADPDAADSGGAISDTADGGASEWDGGPETYDAGEEPDVAPAGIAADVSPDGLGLPTQADVSPPELPDGIALRVVTLNVHGGNESTPEAIGAFFRDIEADIVALQECDEEFASGVAASAGLDYVSSGGGKALIARTPLEDSTHIGLPYGRGVLRAVTSVEDVPFALYAVHIGWDAEGNHQARALVDDVLAAETYPHVIVLGDFNDEHYSSQNDILEEALLDSFSELGWYPGQRISWPAIGFDGAEGSQLIDLIFVPRSLPAIVVSGEVYNTVPPLSDHKPTRADLLFPRDADTPFDEDPFAGRSDPWQGFPPEGERPANRLVNPGAEDGTSGWELSGGAVVEPGRAGQTPPEGASFFAGRREDGPGEAPWSTGRQIVSVAESGAAADEGRLEVLVAGRIAVGFREETLEGETSNVLSPNDQGELVVTCLAGDGAPLWETVSGPRDTYGFHPVVARIPAPPGTRDVEVLWRAHGSSANGPGHDAFFDELYLGVRELADAHEVLGGNLLQNGGAESGDTTGWTGERWVAVRDQSIHGFVGSPVWTWSGEQMFGVNAVVPDPPGSDPARMGQTVDLSQWADVAWGGELALTWGGRVRTVAARTRVTLRLEILDADGTVWGSVAAEPVTAPEWTSVLERTRVPAGASGVRFVVEAPMDQVGVAAYADALFLRPELASAAASSVEE